MHLAAESHVDRSITGSDAFVQTNIVGTYTLLEAARAFWTMLGPTQKEEFRFHHVSTDEVYGDLGKEDAAFDEKHPYAPSSPYSATKASRDHLARAWHCTYGLPVVISNCSNNYGPYQFPEKLIRFVGDRPEHDLRYAIDNSRITRELGWKPQESFATGIEKTVIWYLTNRNWLARHSTRDEAGVQAVSGRSYCQSGVPR